MFSKRKIVIYWVLLSTSIIEANNHTFVYPADEDVAGKQPIRLTQRVPVHAPGLCPENQLLYPGYQKEDWICDCGPGHIFYPAVDGCHPAFLQGPCKTEEILVLPKNDVIPQCVTNECRQDGWIMYEGTCYELDTPGGPCGPFNKGGGTFGVNTTTLELGCIKGPTELSLVNVPSNCPRGSKRSMTRCRQEY